MIPKGSLIFSHNGERPVSFLNSSGIEFPSPVNNITLGAPPGPECRGIVANSDGVIYATGVLNDGKFVAKVYTSQLVPSGIPSGVTLTADVAVDAVGRGYTIRQFPYQALVQFDAQGNLTATWTLTSWGRSLSSGVPLFFTVDGFGIDKNATRVLIRGYIQEQDLFSTINPTGCVVLWNFSGTPVNTIYEPFGSIWNVVGRNCIVFRNSGEVLIGWYTNSDTTARVVRYDASYSVLSTYTLPKRPLVIAQGFDDTTFWVSYASSSSIVTISEIRVSDGVVVNTFTKPLTSVAGGVQWYAPFCVIRADIVSFAPPPSAIIPSIPGRVPTTIVTSPSRSAGCNLGGVGWSPEYTGPSGTVPVGANPVYGELLTGSRIVRVWAEVNHDDTYA